MASVDILVEEIEGDPDSDHVNLVMLATDIPAEAPKARVIEIAPGLNFLVIAATGDQDLEVDEVVGDPDTTNKYLVTPKTLVPQAPAGTTLTGTTYQTTGGPVLVVQLLG